MNMSCVCLVSFSSSFQCGWLCEWVGVKPEYVVWNFPCAVCAVTQMANYTVRQQRQSDGTALVVGRLKRCECSNYTYKVVEVDISNEHRERACSSAHAANSINEDDELLMSYIHAPNKTHCDFIVHCDYSVRIHYYYLSSSLFSAHTLARVVLLSSYVVHSTVGNLCSPWRLMMMNSRHHQQSRCRHISIRTSNNVISSPFHSK